MKGYSEFQEALKKRESGGDYSVINQFGFLGAYQFGKPRLYDLGVSIDGWKPKVWNPKRYRKKQVLSSELFLGNKSIQDSMFYDHILDYMRRLSRNRYRKHLGKLIRDVPVTESGMVAVAHLLGVGGLRSFLKGEDLIDGNGTKASEYMDKFGGYDLESEFIMVI